MRGGVFRLLRIAELLTDQIFKAGFFRKISEAILPTLAPT